MSKKKKPINVYRPNDLITENLQESTYQHKEKTKLDPTFDVKVERKVQKAEGRNNGIEQLGVRLTPEGCIYMATMSVHVYGIKGTPTEAQFISQTTDLRMIPDFLAQHALKELSMDVMRKYGIKPKRKVGDPLEAYQEEL